MTTDLTIEECGSMCLARTTAGSKNKCAKSIKLCVTGDSPQTAGLEACKSDAQVIR